MLSESLSFVIPFLTRKISAKEIFSYERALYKKAIAVLCD